MANLIIVKNDPVKVGWHVSRHLSEVAALKVSFGVGLGRLILCWVSIVLAHRPRLSVAHMCTILLFLMGLNYSRVI